MSCLSKGVTPYIHWLTDKVGGDNGCLFLMLKLFDTQFYAYDEEDTNRVSDALSYRDVYIYNFGQEEDMEWARTAPCSLLEILISLAIKLEDDIMYVPSGGSCAAKWFWMFLENLGLDDLSDAYWSADAEEAVSYSAERFMSREYDSDGSGGNIFVIQEEHCDLDMRKLHLWQQAWEFASFYVPF